MSSVVRWGLPLLIIGMALVYLLLTQAITKRVFSSLIGQQLTGQEALARSLACFLDEQVRQGTDLESAFDGLSGMMALQFGATGGGLSLVDPEGEVVTQLGTSEFRPIYATKAGSSGRELRLEDTKGEITARVEEKDSHPSAVSQALLVRDPRTNRSLPYPSYLRLSQPAAGVLYSGAGASQHQTVALSRIAVNNWALLVHRGTVEAEDTLGMTRLYLLVAFLFLAILLILFVLRFYISLTGVFNAAVQSATALNTASLAFQESLGVMRGPLHNIQGLADMLCLAADQDERLSYGNEIKAEVGKLITLFKKSEF